MISKKFRKTILSILATTIIAVGTTSPAYALNLDNNTEILDVHNRMLQGLPTNVDEQLGIAAPNLAMPGNGSNTGYILIGDSRTAGLNVACGINNTPDNWYAVACSSKGYNYMVNMAMPIAAQIEAAHPEITNWTYVITMGVNDLGKADAFYNYISNLALTKRVCFVSVNPVRNGSPCNKYGYTNDKITKFNSKMMQMPGVKYIDTYTPMVTSGFNTLGDGLHYDEATTRALYSLIRAGV